MIKENFPVYIDNTPKGIDEFKGESHKKIAEAISNIIDNQTKIIKRQVIGLEGDWGSGKSNIIKCLEKETCLKKEKYFHLVFDAWGHQEDLNRRSILEEIIDFLSSKKEYDSFQNKDWKKERKKLTGKTINSEKNSFPEIKIFWILFFTSFTLYSILKELYPIIEQLNFYKHYSNPLQKKIYFQFYIPFFIFLAGLFELREEYIKTREEYIKTKNNRENSNLDNKSIFGQLFSVIQGKEIKSTTTDFVIENEPSNKDFRKFLDFINKKLEIEKKTLILTIDNIDRLTKEKIKSLWSTINIFFADKADDKYYDNIWLIIPYDESKIVNAFIESEIKKEEVGLGLIEKTFAVKFRVPPPIPSNWENLFESKLKLAFGTEIIPTEETEVIKRIFDGFITDLITPRQIINFTNDLVTLHSTNSDIKFRYLSLFIMAKDDIIESPIQNILKNNYWKNKNLEMFFAEDTELEKNISAITFGVPINEAEEIIYSNEIKTIFNTGDFTLLEKFKHNPTAFQNNFYKEFSRLELSNLDLNVCEKIPTLLKRIKELSLIDKYHLNNTYWPNLKNKAIAFDNHKDAGFGLNELHKELFEHRHEFGKEYLEKTIHKMYSEIGSIDSERQYIDKIKNISNFLNEKTNISISDINFDTNMSRNIGASNYIYLVISFPNDFKEIKSLNCNEITLTEYYFIDNVRLDIESLHEDINELEIIKNQLQFSFSRLVRQIKKEIREIKQEQVNDLDKYIQVLKVLSDEKPFKEIEIPFNIIGNINNYKNNEKIFNLLICFSLLKPQFIHTYTNIINQFINPKNINIEKLSLEVEYFITYGDLLKIIIEKKLNFPLIKKIIKEITTNTNLVSLSIPSWALLSFSEIIKLAFEDDDMMSKMFYRKYTTSLNPDIKDYLNNSKDNFKNIDLSIIDYAVEIDNDFSKFLILKSNEYLNGLGTTEIQSIIENQKTFENDLFNKLDLKNKIDFKFTKNKLQPQLIKYLEDFSEGKVSALETNFMILKKFFTSIESSKLKEEYKKFVSKINKLEKLESSQVRFFIDGIITNKLLSKTSPLFLKYFINSRVFNNYFFDKNMYREIIDIVVKHKNIELNKLIWEKVKRKHKENPIKRYAIKKGLEK